MPSQWRKKVPPSVLDNYSERPRGILGTMNIRWLREQKASRSLFILHARIVGQRIATYAARRIMTRTYIFRIGSAIRKPRLPRSID